MRLFSFYMTSPLPSAASLADDIASDVPAPFELAVVMPCLDEADTLAICIKKAQAAMSEHGISGEVIIADNGSSDDSIKIAEELGARVVRVEEKGYGNALRGGISASRSKYVIMGDADDSYDFLEIPRFVEKLRLGHELVQGCRLPRGGGCIAPGAMPWLHRWLGNPIFSQMVRIMFRSSVNDVYCGLRGFTRQLYDELELRSEGMEFATEMVIRSSLYDRDIVEVPITLHPDGRLTHRPHLRTFRDGWRTLRFFMLYSPRWLFLFPGFGMMVLGMIGYALAMPGLSILGATLDAHTLLVASLAILMGYQSVLFAFLAKVFAIGEGILPDDQRVTRLFEVFRLEHGLILGAGMLLSGLSLLTWAVIDWWQAAFGNMDYADTMRKVIPGVTLAALGFQTILSSGFISILGMRRS